MCSVGTDSMYVDATALQYDAAELLLWVSVFQQSDKNLRAYQLAPWHLDCSVECATCFETGNVVLVGNDTCTVEAIAISKLLPPTIFLSGPTLVHGITHSTFMPQHLLYCKHGP